MQRSLKNLNLLIPRPLISQPAYHQKGYTFIEILVIMLITSILVASGSRLFLNAFDGADIQTSIIEMRRMANSFSILINRGTDTIVNFPNSGKVSALNASQTIFKYPENNKFDNDYYFSLTPTIMVSSTFPIANIHPVGFSDDNVSNGSTSTILTVQYRTEVKQRQYHRLDWVKRFYYSQNDGTLIDRQTNQNGFEATNFLGDFASE